MFTWLFTKKYERRSWQLKNLKAKPISAHHPPYHVEDKRHPRFPEWLKYQAIENLNERVPLSFNYWLAEKEAQ